MSTSASIPDYRGPNGIWTKLEKGQEVTVEIELAKCKPTLGHMALSKLVKEELVMHVVSQNCDGLHLRSGIDQDSLSELHGNRYHTTATLTTSNLNDCSFIEVCSDCRPHVEVIRSFDVTGGSKYRFAMLASG